MKAALYTRVSTDDKSQTSETQLLALRQFCKDAGWEICGEYIDSAQAKDYTNRRQWQQLQKDSRQRNFKAVLVFRLDLAFRSVRECVNCLRDWHRQGIAFKSLEEAVVDTGTSQGQSLYLTSWRRSLSLSRQSLRGGCQGCREQKLRDDL